MAPCLTCLDASLCYTCEGNYSYLPSNYSCLRVCPEKMVTVGLVCQQCSSNCLTCSTLTLCLSCPSGSYLHNGTCTSPCPVEYYANVTLGTCQNCHYSCYKCLNYTTCTVCQTGYELQTDSSCLSLCPSHQIPINGICKDCTSTCSGCQQTTTNCTGCLSNYSFSPS